MDSEALSLNLPVSLGNSKRTVIFVGLFILSFAIPFSLGYPQWLVGTIINTCLFSGAIFLPKKFLIPLIILPSLGVLARGVLFGPFTLFLVYFLPFIWLGNLILILSFKKLYGFNHIFSMISAVVFKFLFLMAIANIYFNFKIVPVAFLQAMGIFQLLTALAGGIISLIIFKTWKTQIQK